MSTRTRALTLSVVVLMVLALLPGTTAIAQVADPTADSITLAQLAYPDGAPAVGIARDDESADALSSGYGQGQFGGPLLLTDTDELEQSVIDEIQRLGATTAYIYGGTAAVSQAVEDALADMDLAIVRYEGASRLETALDTYDALGPDSTTVILARAFGVEGNPTAQFADSIGGGAMAAALGYPVLLSQTEILSGPTAAALEASPVQRVIILGGTAAISTDTEDDLRTLGMEVVRLSGAERTTTATAIAGYVGANAGPVSRVILVDGFAEFGWASGFAAAAAARGGDTVILLVNGDTVPQATQDWLAANPTANVVCGPNVAATACAAAGGGGEGRYFTHVATYDVTDNGNTSAEIVDHWPGGEMLVFTDSPNGSLGLVDISTPSAPTGAGVVDLGGEPTSVAVLGDHALVGINTSESFTSPSGELRVYDLTDFTQPGTPMPVATLDMGGQPDSVAVAPSGDFAAVAIENERDEDLGGGLIPQLPAGKVVVVDTSAADPAMWTTADVDLTGLTGATAPSDPEPEYVDFSSGDDLVVTLQENNHLAIIDPATATVVDDYTQGSVALTDVDATEEEIGPQGNGDLQPTETITRRREADAVSWIDADSYFTANEGDYEDGDGVEGGSRGWTIFNVDGTVEWESNASFEHWLISAGHYPEGRSANKGVEPEGAETGVYGDQTLAFVGAERANAVGVYDVTDATSPMPLQVLPTGIGPEGLKAIPSRDLFVVASETNLADEEEDAGLPTAYLTIYQRGAAAPAYPQLSSAQQAGVAIPWVAQSGLAAGEGDVLYSVSDSILGVGYIYRIDAGARPAMITSRTPVTGASFNLDLEGIAVDPAGGFWLASEGRYVEGVEQRPNALVRVDAAGAVQAEYELPAALVAGATSSGFEGVALGLDDMGATEYVYGVIQRGWADDAEGTVRIARLDVAAGTWAFAAYELDDVDSPNGGWVGLSEITAMGDGTFAIIERDNQLGDNARIKRIYAVDLADATFVPHGQALTAVPKTLVADVLGTLSAAGVITPDKLEGLAVTGSGDAWMVTDNDGLDDALGQSLFLPVDLGLSGR